MAHSDSLLTRISLEILENTNFIVTLLTAYFVLYTKSAGAVYFVAGATTCSLSVKVIKRVIQQPRPPVVAPAGRRKRSYGMPSTHSATITFYATYILLGCLYLDIHPSLPKGLNIRYLGPSMAIPCAMTIMMSRIWLGHHTWPQVAAGASYGIVCGLLWFYAWKNGLDMYGERMHSWWSTDEL